MSGTVAPGKQRIEETNINDYGFPHHKCVLGGKGDEEMEPWVIVAG